MILIPGLSGISICQRGRRARRLSTRSSTFDNKPVHIRPPAMLYTPALLLLAAVELVHGFSVPRADYQPHHNNKTVLILGGGVAGVIAARTLHQQGIDNFIIIEGRDELGGRLRSFSFGGKTIELGANWVQGTQVPGGPANPILTLVEKHKVKTEINDYSSFSMYLCRPMFSQVLIISYLHSHL